MIAGWERIRSKAGQAIGGEGDEGQALSETQIVKADESKRSSPLRSGKPRLRKTVNLERSDGETRKPKPKFACIELMDLSFLHCLSYSRLLSGCLPCFYAAAVLTSSCSCCSLLLATLHNIREALQASHPTIDVIAESQTEWLPCS